MRSFVRACARAALLRCATSASEESTRLTNCLLIYDPFRLYDSKGQSNLANRRNRIPRFPVLSPAREISTIRESRTRGRDAR